jgi:hypothetical protein
MKDRPVSGNTGNCACVQALITADYRQKCGHAVPFATKNSNGSPFPCSLAGTLSIAPAFEDGCGLLTLARAAMLQSAAVRR